MQKYRESKENDIILRVPPWATRIYLMLAVVLLPWTVYIGLTLPQHHLSAHWNISWAGLDIGMIVALAATGLFAYIRSIWIVIAAATTGSLLLVDAWFDVMSERTSTDFHQALILAFMFELPLAMLSYYLASHALRHNTQPKKRRKQR
ncbi:MAG TPA: hypothetical protein VMR28_02920 [Candidatus Saccharimonadales bacterium]|nr:hypothetical protein [Candidatus Saccharimonadales bacterium]